MNRNLKAKPDTDNVSRDKTNIPDYLSSSTNKMHMPDYFYSSDNKEANKRVSETITYQICNEFNDLFSGIGSLEGILSLQVKEGSHLYQAPPGRVASACKATKRKAGTATVAENYCSVRC